MEFDLNTILDNVNWLTVVLALVVCVVFYGYIQWIHLPPGPMGLPYLGYYPFLGRDFHLQLHNMSKRYGDVFCIRCAGKLFVYLGSTRAIKEVNITKSDCFASRITTYSIFHDTFDGGVLMMNGEKWKEMRRFFVQTLKDLGLGKNTQESVIGDFLEKTVNTLRKTNGENFDALSFITHTCSEVIYSVLLSGSKVTEDDMKKFSEAYLTVTDAVMGKKMLLTGPLLRLMMYVHPEYRRYKKCKYIVDEMLTKIIEEHEKDFDKDNIRDIVDCYISMRKELEEKGDSRSEIYTAKALRSTLLQFIGDGGFSVGFLIAVVFKELYTRPEMQKEIQREIDNVVGRSRLPCWDDKRRMLYTNAFIQECMRNNAFFTMLPSVECTKETTVGDCRVPKGAETLVSYWASFHDPDVYEDPEKFDPTRFLPKDDEQKPRSDFPIFFGTGKRSCIGEPLVMMETFLFVTTVLQNFDLHPAEKSEPESTESSLMEELNVVLRATPRVS